MGVYSYIFNSNPETLRKQKSPIAESRRARVRAGADGIRSMPVKAAQLFENLSLSVSLYLGQSAQSRKGWLNRDASWPACSPVPTK